MKPNFLTTLLAATLTLISNSVYAGAEHVGDQASYQQFWSNADGSITKLPDFTLTIVAYDVAAKEYVDNTGYHYTAPEIETDPKLGTDLAACTARGGSTAVDTVMGIKIPVCSAPAAQHDYVTYGDIPFGIVRYLSPRPSGAAIVTTLMSYHFAPSPKN